MAKIDETYHNLLYKISREGFNYEDPRRKGVFRKQIPSFQFEHKFEDGFPAITTKKLYWKGVVAELLWFLRGDTNIKYLLDNNVHIWNKDAYNYYLKMYDGCPEDFICDDIDGFIDTIKGKINGHMKLKGNLGRIYGAQWRTFGQGKEWDANLYEQSKGTDQISNLIKGLKETPMGTQHIVTAWNPTELDDMALPPCHWSFEILVEPLNIFQREEYAQKQGYNTLTNNGNFHGVYLTEKYNIPKYQFTLKWHQRSVDTFLGLPFNIASYALLAHIIGKMTNMIPLGIIGDLSNVHIYDNHFKAVEKQLIRDVYKHKACELNMSAHSEVILSQENNLLDDKLKVQIEDFTLKNYNSYDSISAEMLARDN